VEPRLGDYRLVSRDSAVLFFKRRLDGDTHTLTIAAAPAAGPSTVEARFLGGPY
jgi:hypothetical protein